MPHFDIVRKTHPKKTFRVANVMGTYDLQSEQVEQHFTGDINLPEEWNIGLIVGRSGTGKTTIARELFGEDVYQCGVGYTHECLLDDFPKDAQMKDIYSALSAVGFSSPTDWLKPYAVLSNGEKMRCDIARAIVSGQKMIVFDEYTSVVDRNVAKVASLALQKIIRRKGMRFIAVSCHYDIGEWLMPDWMFCTDDMQFRLLDLAEQKKNRPRLKLDIYEIKGANEKIRMWNVFRRYHYLSNSFNTSARTFVGVINGEMCCFISYLHFPHPTAKNIKQTHRLVVLPDYQGIGIGTKLLSFIGDYVAKQSGRFTIVSSNPALVFALGKNKSWLVKRCGRTRKSKTSRCLINKSVSDNRLTASFEYIKSEKQ